ncbi:hypothetical protein HY571_01245 [Candidatus Micrarchaeota archaeon]|nr:hypothetical protein [Candidatus Micrarchaeota archaeon]
MSKNAKKQAKALKQKLDNLDELVRKEGERDIGSPRLSLCPRCGSSDLGIRRIDIPGFAPEVRVCNRCGFRSESAVQVSPIEYVEEAAEEEGMNIEEIQKRLESAEFKTKEKKPKKKAAKPKAEKQKVKKKKKR